MIEIKPLIQQTGDDRIALIRLDQFQIGPRRELQKRYAHTLGGNHERLTEAGGYGTVERGRLFNASDHAADVMKDEHGASIVAAPEGRHATEKNIFIPHILFIINKLNTNLSDSA